MDFAQQLRRAEQLAKTGSLVMQNEHDPPDGRLWLPREKPEPNPPMEVWIDQTVNYLDIDRIGRRSRRSPLEEERVVIEFIGTPDPDSDLGRWWKAECERRADAATIHHDDGTMSVPANHPRLRPHVCFTAPASSASPSS